MGLIVRSLRNLIRSPIRTILIVVILAFSTGLALIMLNVTSAFSNQLGSVSESIGTEIQVRPAGSFGFMGGGGSLDEDEVAKLYDLPNVVDVQETVQAQYTGDSLVSAVVQFPGDNAGGDLGGNGGSSGFSMPIIVMGFDVTTESPQILGGGQVEIVQGRYFTTEEANADVVVLGEGLADYNGLGIGSTVDIYGTAVEVVGIFSSGQAFGDSMLIFPIETAQRLFDIDGLTSVTVIADNVANVDSVADAIKQTLGEDTVDVVTTEDMYQRIGSTIDNASSTSQIGMISALVIAAVVIIFAVILMVRQRVKEIGILKAIGASNWHINLQFATESLIMSVTAVVLGALMSLPLGQTVANLLISSTGSSGIPSNGPSAGGMAFGGGRFLGGGSTIVGINVAISSEVFLIALGIAIALAIIASIFPSWYVARIKPAEVLRSE